MKKTNINIENQLKQETTPLFIKDMFEKTIVALIYLGNWKVEHIVSLFFFAKADMTPLAVYSYNHSAGNRRLQKKKGDALCVFIGREPPNKVVRY